MTNSSDRMPALALAVLPGRRDRGLALAKQIEERGYSGIWCPSFGAGVDLCTSIAHVTERIRFGTAIQPIYLRHPSEMATTAQYISEISGGRFWLGLGVTHGPVQKRLDVEVGKPLTDMRSYLEAMRAAAPGGQLPPIALATLRRKMVELSVEIGDGALWANGARSHMAASLEHVPAERRDSGFLVGNMIPTVVSDDLAAARDVHRKTLTGYVSLPNYRNYWKEAGYVGEMEAIEAALANGERDRLPSLMTDDWLDDVTISGPAGRVREEVERWFDAGVDTPILVPSSTNGGQAKAFEEIFAVWS